MARKHAVVMGASMAGLMAAPALSDHFEQVTILERDELPVDPQVRRGVPQARHTHGLLAGGRQEIERVFPGITQQMLEGGAASGDLAKDFRWYFEGGCLAQVESGLKAVAASRPFIEGFVRARTTALPNVKLRQGCQVESLESAGGRVVGVRADGALVTADLVVDATGRGSRSPAWLKDMGHEAPVEEKIEIGVRYTTRFFRRDPHHLNGDCGKSHPAHPQRQARRRDDRAGRRPLDCNLDRPFRPACSRRPAELH